MKNTTDRKLKESPPHHEFYQMLKAFLAYDKTVKVSALKEEITPNIEFDIRIADPRKLFAFEQMLKLYGEDSGLTYTINIVPANKKVAAEAEALREKAGEENASISRALKDFFKDNPAFSRVKVVPNPIDFRRDVFCVFNPVFVQYWADNIGSIFGANTETYEQVAKKIFRDDIYVFFCTEKLKKDQ